MQPPSSALESRYKAEEADGLNIREIRQAYTAQLVKLEGASLANDNLWATILKGKYLH